MSKKTALIAGATGLVGNELLHLLLNDDYYDRVISIGRRKQDINHQKLVQEVVDFDFLEKEKGKIVADHIFCCLGTTMKKAGSKEAFYKVDHTYPLKIAELALQNEAKQFFLVSAIGADKDSNIFYNKVKGEIEIAICKLPYKAVNIFRPSLLLGKRNEARLGEDIAKLVSKILTLFMVGPLKKYKPIYAKTVANSMLKIAKQDLSGVYIFESHKIKML